MNARQQSQFKMFQATALILTRHNALWKDIAHIAEAHQYLSTQLEEITKLLPRQQQTQAGQVEEKTDLKHTLAQLTAQVATAIKAYAVKKKDKDLEKKVAGFREASLKRASETDLISIATLVYSLTQGVEKELLFITAEILASLQTTTVSYKEASPELRSDSAGRQVGTENIKTLVSDTSLYLRKTMDSYLEPFAKKYPDFYKEYKIARKLVPPTGGGKKAAKDKEPPKNG